MAGLKISTFWRAICARRSRRISSSVLPLYMLPTITSIQPEWGNGSVGSDMVDGRYSGGPGGVNGADAIAMCAIAARVLACAARRTRHGTHLRPRHARQPRGSL